MRDRSQRLLLWVSAFTFVPLIELILNGLHLHVSGIWLTFFIQISIQVREVAQWYLLVYLLQLNESRNLMRFLKIAASITLTAGILDGASGFVLTQLSQAQFGITDAFLTAFLLPCEAIPKRAGRLRPRQAQTAQLRQLAGCNLRLHRRHLVRRFQLRLPGNSLYTLDACSEDG